jgi:hypothetical protein
VKILPEEAASLNFNLNRPLLMTVLVDFTDGATGAFRQILEVVFPADLLLARNSPVVNPLSLQFSSPPPHTLFMLLAFSVILQHVPVLPRNNVCRN